MPHLAHPLDVSALTTMEKAPGDPTLYHVWQALNGNDEGVPQGKYLVDDSGQPKYLVDPAINGVVTHRDDGTPVQKFKAPKTALMALLTEGILTQKLSWTLVLLGVAIALVLELSGVPSLPFAVGVYLPLSSSTPIFVGGLMRYLADRFGRKSNGPAPSEAESEMGPGVLLSTGYIAGGAIGAVLIAFLNFSDEIPRQLSTWQYRQTAIVEAKPLQQQYEDAAAVDLGIKTRESDVKARARSAQAGDRRPGGRDPRHQRGAVAAVHSRSRAARNSRFPTRKRTKCQPTPRWARLPAKSRAPRSAPRSCRP